MEEKDRICVFCEERWDNLKHYVEEYTEVTRWMEGLGNNSEDNENAK